MLSSYTSNPQFMSSMNTGPFPHSYGHREEFFLKPTTTPLNLPKHINSISTSITHQGLKGPIQSQPTFKEQQKVSSYPISFSQLDATKNIEPLNIKRPNLHLNKSDKPESYAKKKKVKKAKEDQTDVFERFVNGFKTQEDGVQELIDGIISSSYQPNNAETWLDSDENDPIKEFFGEKRKIEESHLRDITMALDLIKNDFSNKYEAIKDRNYYLSINFGFPCETPQRSESLSELSINSPSDDSSNSPGLNEKKPGSNFQQTNLLHEKKKAYQVIKNGLDAISESDYQRLKPEVYLNDNLINFYLKLIENGFLSEERKKKCYFFNTYFMAQMGRLFNEVGKDLTQFDYIYDKMKKWTKKIDLFQKDFLFIPVNDNDHWNVIVLCYPYKLFSKDNDFPFVMFFDSLCRMDTIYSSMLFQFFSREVKAKMPNELVTLNSKRTQFNVSFFPYFQHMVPKQSNGTDCGLYLLQFVEMFAEDETYIMQRKEDLNKMKWFPRKLIENKREDIMKIIKDLRVNKFETIAEYLQKKKQILFKYGNDNSQYDTFNPEGFEKALIKTYSGRYLTEQDKRCLMLDYYFLGTLDYDEIVRKK